MDLLHKRYKDGGLTLDQFTFLTKRAVDSKYTDQHFLAAINGIDLDKALKKAGKEQVREPQKTFGGPIFGDPREYAKMTQAQRDAEMERVKGALKGVKIL